MAVIMHQCMRIFNNNAVVVQLPKLLKCLVFLLSPCVLYISYEEHCSYTFLLNLQFTFCSLPLKYLAS